MTELEHHMARSMTANKQTHFFMYQGKWQFVTHCRITQPEYQLARQFTKQLNQGK